LPRPETFWRRASVSDRRNIAGDRLNGIHLRRAVGLLKERWTIVEAIATSLENDGFVSPESVALLMGIDARKVEITHKQGQYLAFIHTYTRLNGRAPAEADMQMYFRVTPPTVHQMILTTVATEGPSRFGGIIATLPPHTPPDRPDHLLGGNGCPPHHRLSPMSSRR